MTLTLTTKSRYSSIVCGWEVAIHVDDSSEQKFSFTLMRLEAVVDTVTYVSGVSSDLVNGVNLAYGLLGRVMVGDPAEDRDAADAAWREARKAVGAPVE